MLINKSSPAGFSMLTEIPPTTGLEFERDSFTQGSRALLNTVVAKNISEKASFFKIWEFSQFFRSHTDSEHY